MKSRSRKPNDTDRLAVVVRCPVIGDHWQRTAVRHALESDLLTGIHDALVIALRAGKLDEHDAHR